MKKREILLSVGLLLALQSPASAACVSFFNFHLASEGPWQSHGTIRQGQTCSGNYTASGIMVFKRLYLAQAPAHGTVRLKEGGSYFYTAASGYSGSDSFTLRVCGKEGAIDGCANIVYNMNII